MSIMNPWAEGYINIKIPENEDGFDTVYCSLYPEKLATRNLCVFLNGKIYYAPLVHSGEDNDSGVKVRCDGEEFAISNGNTYFEKILLPDTLIQTGRPLIYKPGECFFGGDSRLRYYNNLVVPKASQFEKLEIGVTFFPEVLDKSQYIFFLTNSFSASEMALTISTSGRISYTHGGTEYYSKKLYGGAPYRFIVRYENATMTAVCNQVPYTGGVTETATLSVAAGSYSVAFGSKSGNSLTDPFTGTLSDIYITLNGTTERLRFGG